MSAPLGPTVSAPAETVEAMPPMVAGAPPMPAATHRRRATRLPPWEGATLGVILALSAFLNLFRLDREGYANQYYAAAVKSMLQSWRNFFFVAFDPGGFVSVDKPPVGFWIQTAFAKVLGFSGLSLLLPEALAGVGAVALLWWLVRRAWGPAAGLLAALALAVTPISVVTARNNTIDSLLVLCLLGAAWSVTRAVESRRHAPHWLLLTAALVGLGFNIKMLQAYLALPALWFVYLVAARPGWRARVGHLALATVVMLAVSLSWTAAVDLTPASQRPYVGSSSNNTVTDLIVGWNGLDRLFGGRLTGNRGREAAAAALNAETVLESLAGGSAQGFGPGGTGETGVKGPLRLLDPQLGGQIGWLLPLAVAGLLLAGWQLRPRRPRWWWTRAGAGGAGLLRRRRAAVALWGAWFLTMATFFSIAGMFHRYYLTMLAPGVAALTGIGAVALWREWRRPVPGPRLGWGWLGWAVLAIPLATAAVQARLLASYPDWSRRLMPPIVALCAAAAIALLVTRLPWRWGRSEQGRAVRIAGLALTVSLLALLIAPATWAGISVNAAATGLASPLPSAGPAVRDGFGGPFGSFPGGPPYGARPGRDGATAPNNSPPPGGPGQPPFGGPPGGFERRGRLTDQEVRWLIDHQGTATYLVAVTSANQAAPLILQTGLPVMATGGFLGSDPILTADSLAQLVHDGKVRYFLLGGGFDRGGFGVGGNGFSVASWVTRHCATVPTSTWSGAASGQTSGFGQQLYDCGTGQ